MSQWSRSSRGHRLPPYQRALITFLSGQKLRLQSAANGRSRGRKERGKKEADEKAPRYNARALSAADDDGK